MGFRRAAVDDPVGHDTRCRPGDCAEQQRDHVALVGGHFLADDQPQRQRCSVTFARRPLLLAHPATGFYDFSTEGPRGAHLAREQRRLAAIVSADVAGYSRLMGRDESGTLAALKALRRELIDPAIDRHSGRIVKTTGDGLLLEFASVVEAVRCVLDVQSQMAARAGAIAFRIGVNIGDIIIDEGDIFGDGVNVAARLQEIAQPGGVAVSARVHEDVRDRLDATFVDAGPQALKNIARSVHVWRWSPVGAPGVVPSAPLALPDKPSIAVLPFQNMSGNAEQEHFADGMTEDILTGLARFQNLFVIARNSSFTYKGQAVDVKKVGAELGVRYVLEGSIRAAGQRVRITAQLIDAPTAHHVWAERYDRALTDIFDIQDEVTTQIVAAIDFEVREAEAQRSRGVAAAGLEAWAQYHKAFPLLFRLTQEDNQRATALFDALRTSYSAFAAGHAGYGFSLTSDAIYGWTGDRQATARAAIAPCRHAVDLDDKDAFCHLALGRALLIAGERDLALASIERAVARNPNAALARMFRGMALIGLERYAEAIVSVDLAIRLSPRDPGIWSFYLWRATCHAALGNIDAAVEAARQAVRERPDLWQTHITLASILARTSRRDEAKAAMARAQELHPGLTLDELRELNSLFVSATLLQEIDTLITPLGLPRRPVGPASLPLPDKPSIAVLPFQNMSGDPEQEYFADGMVEDIITALSRFKSLFVIARNSSFSYKGKSPDIRQVGRELGVRYVLEGSIRKAANRIRVTGQLIDTLTGNHIWAERYDRVLEDIFAVQEEVTQAIVAAIAPQITSTERSKAIRRRPSNLSAYEIALRAWVHMGEGHDKADQTLIDQSIREAREALAIDPTSVLALQALARAHGIALFLQMVPDREQALRDAALATSRALELDDENPYSYALRGLGCLLSGHQDRYPEALADARRAHEMNPNDVDVLQIVGNLEATVGEPERAIEHLHQVMRLDPRASRSAWTYNLLAFASFGAKQYPEGIGWALRALRDMPRMLQPHVNLACCLVGTGEIDKAKATFEAGQKLAPEFFRVRLEGSASPFTQPEDRKRLQCSYALPPDSRTRVRRRHCDDRAAPPRRDPGRRRRRLLEARRQ